MSFVEALEQGLMWACEDYTKIASGWLGSDVKPKEDQIKCALYEAFRAAEYHVHVEPSHESDTRCDLIVKQGNGSHVGVEIKTAWAATNWMVKPSEQERNWKYDIEKLKMLIKDDSIKKGYLIVLLASEKDSPAEKKLRDMIQTLPACRKSRVGPVPITPWNGLDMLQFFVVTVKPA